MLTKFIHTIFKNSRPSQKDGNFCQLIGRLIGEKPVDMLYYRLAFTHRSMNLTDEQGCALNYERLEFLGDAMLGAVVASYLYLKADHGDEGYLTKMRSKIVSRENLNDLGKRLQLVQHLESKLGTQQFGENIHGNLLESLIGAIYLDKGYPACERFIQKKLLRTIADIPQLETKVISYKSLLIEWCQKNKHNFVFQTYEEDSADAHKYFGVRLSINGRLVAKGRATSKKKAEEKAAQRAYFALQDKINK